MSDLKQELFQKLITESMRETAQYVGISSLALDHDQRASYYFLFCTLLCVSATEAINVSMGFDRKDRSHLPAIRAALAEVITLVDHDDQKQRSIMVQDIFARMCADVGKEMCGPGGDEKRARDGAT